jgi:hypothetical protein
MPGLNLTITALTLPEGTEFPGNMQDLEDLIAQYLFIDNQGDFSGINYGDTEPAPENRDRPWFETDASGNPIGWKSWNGSAWTAIPIVVPSGNTGSRPSSPSTGTLYRDTTIGTVIIYSGSQWVTLDGTSGDVKFVVGTVLADVLAKNPGWSHYTDGIGRVLAGAAADGSDAENDVGADEVTLSEAQLPAHTHDSIQGQTSTNVNGGGPLSNGFMSGDTNTAGVNTWPNSVTGSTGDGDPIDNRQNTRYVFMLVKD